MEGNQQKMREALVAMVEAETDGSMDRDDLCDRCLEKMWNSCKHDGSCWVDKVINALAAPPRNCDVGTPDEQEKRWHKNCGHGIPNCFNCKVYGQAKEIGLVNDRGLLRCSCEFIFAQMPYEQEGVEK